MEKEKGSGVWQTQEGRVWGGAAQSVRTKLGRERKMSVRGDSRSKVTSEQCKYVFFELT